MLLLHLHRQLLLILIVYWGFDSELGQLHRFFGPLVVPKLVRKPVVVRFVWFHWERYRYRKEMNDAELSSFGWTLLFVQSWYFKWYPEHLEWMSRMKLGSIASKQTYIYIYQYNSVCITCVPSCYINSTGWRALGRLSKVHTHTSKLKVFIGRL